MNPVSWVKTKWRQSMNAVFLRLVRVGISTVLGILASQYGDNKYYLAIIPVVNAIGKAMRDLYPGKFEWLPI